MADKIQINYLSVIYTLNGVCKDIEKDVWDEWRKLRRFPRDFVLTFSDEHLNIKVKRCRPEIKMEVGTYILHTYIS